MGTKMCFLKILFHVYVFPSDAMVTHTDSATRTHFLRFLLVFCNQPQMSYFTNTVTTTENTNSHPVLVGDNAVTNNIYSNSQVL